MILNIDGIEFSYSSVPVLKNIRFDIKRGELLSILGNNGAGKSTLLKCINKILKPHKGTIYIEEEDILKLDRVEIAKKIGYVAQRNENGRFTVFDAVLLGRKPHIKWDVTKKDLKIVNDVINKFNLDKLSLRYLSELSGGELQKVVIARALAQQPLVILLDEPTNNLDLKNQIEVLRIIKQTVKEQNIAAIVIIHDLNLALRFSDKFLLLKDNSIYAYGGEEIMTEENIEAVYDIPVAVERVHDIKVVIPL
ncbi:MAG: iron complex transport system ATP-binding protein [Thermoanaerobacterium sp.]|jgi:ABC transporter.|uniref:Iron complex transport system ATP-binding protein n=1 Tax=Thermoanaerobacterium butyriciformans TaxID=1702242 RepID=A0ABS4NEK3_9THEO|nr:MULTISPECIES: ABC transporter ATP-binding protein [Thermoanaerobacterium]MDK2806197.1 iron complex transport system ATP-binding protein [Thermoanaerobacterium sp.]WHE06493.1 ABC transporter ATP-binding protein [Thermoanaerobacterium thermosaccharolyticum]MBP2071482.1 iron complex transport system ATP-binding protein [Thermoanaerobacterium butyriciformans]MDN5316835.1 iron complex transport system ATP-binding protein [Thermoanaerobacterium sp.]WKV09640.1 ABC transporter ATP-binding protein [